MSSAFDSLWRMMIDHNIKPVTTDRNLNCTICDKVMRNAYISSCDCHFCKVCLDDYLDGSIKRCPGIKKECSLGHNLLINENIFPDNGANIKILKLIVKCPNDDCECELEYGKIEDHLRVCEESTSECPYLRFGCERKEKRDNVLLHLQNEDVSHAKLVVDVIDFLRNELNSVKNELREAKLETEKVRRIFEHRLGEESQHTQDALEKMRGLITVNTWKASNRPYEDSDSGSNLGSVQALSTTNSFLNYEVGGINWKIADFSEVKDRAINNPAFFEYSPLFLSHEDGYMFNLVLYANGFAVGKGTHLYIGFCIAKGCNDDHLQWPFRDTIEISLVDQISNLPKVTKQFQYESLPKNKKNLFDKPTKRYNYNCGDPKFIELSTLRKSGTLLLNDCLLVKCVVRHGYA